MKPRQHRAAETRPFGLSQLWAGSRIPEFGFECVKMLEMFEEPAGDFRRGLAGFVKLAPHMGQAAGEYDRFAAAPGEAVVSLVAVALDGAAEVHRVNFLQTGRGTTGLPMEDDIAARHAAGPKVTQLGLVMAGGKIAGRRCVHLHVATAEHASMDLPVDGLEPPRRARPIRPASGAAARLDGASKR